MIIVRSGFMSRLMPLLVGAVICGSSNAMAAEEPYYRNSIVSKDVDFIKSDDPTVSSVITYLGTSRREMPDRRNDVLFDSNAYVFNMEFADGTSVEILAHSSFKDLAKAEHYSKLLKGPIGKLPFQMRNILSQVVVHTGNETAFSEHLGHFFVLYSLNMEERIRNNDLEETVFHESVHATLDYKHSEAIAWTKAQKADGTFVTNYAADNPDTEDFAESAIFALTLKKHPDRLSEDLRSWLIEKIPNRITCLNGVLSDLDEM